MSHTLNQAIGSPCPLGHHIYGFWSLVLKVVLVLLLVTIPITNIGILILGTNILHNGILVEDNRKVIETIHTQEIDTNIRAHTDILNQLDRIIKKLDNLNTKMK